MDTAQARRLIELNSTFYRENAVSFAQTRQAPWPGWAACLGQLKDLWCTKPGPRRCLDVACGNLRFEAYLQEELPQLPLELYAADNCAALQDNALARAVAAHCALHYQPLDVLGALAAAWDAGGRNAHDAAARLAQAIEAPPCDLVVSFGFMHHVPRAAWREVLLRALVQKTVPGGYVCVSFWQFMNDEGLAEKARRTTVDGCQALGFAPAMLEEGDHLLGWNGQEGAYRYCHHFAEEEIDTLVAGVADVAHVIARFSADGRTGALNSYVVLQRLG